MVSSLALYAMDDYSLGYMKGYEDAIGGVSSTYDALLVSLEAERKQVEVASGAAQEDYGNWKLRYYVDSFGDDTDVPYVTLDLMEGSFSNSATTNSSLEWKFLIDNEDATIMLFEYGSSRVNGSSSSPDEYSLQVKDPAGATKSFKFMNYSDRLYCLNYESFISLLAKGQKLKIIIEEQSDYGYPSRYNLGTVDMKGFAAIYQKMLDLSK
jgi:hypothetical protein